MKINQITKLSILLSLLTTGSIHSTSLQTIATVKTNAEEAKIKTTLNKRAAILKKKEFILSNLEAIRTKKKAINKEKEVISSKARVVFDEIIATNDKMYERLNREGVIPEAKHDTLLAEHDTLLAKHDTLLAKFKILTTEFDILTAEHDTLLAEFKILTTEYGTLPVAELESLAAEHTHQTLLGSLFRLLTTVVNFFRCKRKA